MSEHYEPKFEETEDPTGLAPYCGYTAGYVRKSSVFGRSEFVPPIVIFLDETIWLRPPLRTDPLANMIPSSDPAKIADQLSLKVDKFIRSTGQANITGADIRREFGSWCDVKPNERVLMVELDRVSEDSFSVTFYLRGEPTREITGPIEHVDLMVAILLKAYGRKVKVAD